MPWARHCACDSSQDDQAIARHDGAHRVHVPGRALRRVELGHAARGLRVKSLRRWAKFWRHLGTVAAYVTGINLVCSIVHFAEANWWQGWWSGLATCSSAWVFFGAVKHELRVTDEIYDQTFALQFPDVGADEN